MSTTIKITGTSEGIGPNLISGSELKVVNANGEAIDVSGKEMVALCACGHSANKPFCDGSHKKG